MTVILEQQSAPTEHPSGKGSGDENFPVGSLLIAASLRPHVHAFYRFARNADDVADAPDLPPEDKLRRLDRMGAVLDGAPGDDAPAAAAMRRSLQETAVPPVHCHELLGAFRQDATKQRYADWKDLMAYCRLSAAPVGRYLLDLHGEDHATWPAADALCDALQVINHLQDCGDDYRRLDRVYVPLDMLAAEGADVGELGGSACSPALRRALDQMIERTGALVHEAGRLPGGVRSRGLRAESAVIIALAGRLLVRLARHDPLAGRVKLGAGSIALAVAGGLFNGLTGGR
jgi:farnesyl-diphosphate farnesyltransferase